MNGRFLLDTNAVVALLNGNLRIAEVLKPANWVGISIITELEFLSFPGLTPDDEALFQAFRDRVEVIDLQAADAVLLAQIVAIRKSGSHKMPDAIIAACAIHSSATLLTQDRNFSKISNLLVQAF